MEPITLAVVIGLVMLIVMLSGMPIAFSLGAVAMGAILILLDPLQFNMLPETIFHSANSFELLCIPLFVLMGAAFAGSQASGDLFEALYKWLHKLPGSLAITSEAACAIFAALSGSSPATAAAIGTVAIPEMRKRGYPDALAAGAIVGGGTLGILIPPSITLILYGISVEVSIGKLFLGGVLPGILLTVLFSIWILLDAKIFHRSSFRHSWQSADGKVVDTRSVTFSWGERFAALIKVIPFVLLIVAVLGSLYGGVATPSEAAAVGAIMALILILVVYRSLTFQRLIEILKNTTNESTMIMMILIMAALLGVVMSFLMIPQTLASTIAGLNVNRWVIMGLINVLLLILGCFLPPAAIIVITAPILKPIILALGFDPLWFGVIMTINMEAGLITPPVGLNLYVVKGIAPDIPMAQIIKGSMPFFLMILLLIVIMCFYPQLVLWLPNTLIK